MFRHGKSYVTVMAANIYHLRLIRNKYSVVALLCLKPHDINCSFALVISYVCAQCFQRYFHLQHNR